jgi:hypothetical protein
MLADIPHLHFTIPSNTLEQFWQPKAAAFSTPGSGWQAALNHAALQALLPWLRETFSPEMKLWIREAALPSVWELVTGFAVEDQQNRWVILPTAAIDFSELRVPQEWVDIPSWAGDYYLSVYVNPSEGVAEVLGYTTHKILKSKGEYDSSDRCYSLDESDLIADINVLQVTRDLGIQEELRQAIGALPMLPTSQAENLLTRLGDATVLRPRLAIPFELWGALISHGGWRQAIYQKRLGLAEAWSVPQWLQQGLSNLAQDWGWHRMELQPQLVSSGRGTERSNRSILTRQLRIAGNVYELTISPKGDGVWRFELQSGKFGGMVPGGFKLRLLTEDLSSFENNEDVAATAVEQLFLEVQVGAGDGLVWQTEPQPEGYEPEILRF